MNFYWLAAATCPTDIDLGFLHFTWLQIIFLGIVQGITELLPISSTAHIRIVPALLGWGDPGSAFSAAMQLASLIAVISYFWTDIKQLTSGVIRAIGDGEYDLTPFRIVVGMLVGTLPIIVAGLLLKKTLNATNSPLRNLAVIGVVSIVMSSLLAIAERRGQHKRTFDQLTFKDGILVGIAQAFALIPGVSRSGSTLTAGIFLKMERTTAARFSFLLGLPAVFLAGLVEIHTLSSCLNGEGWMLLAIGLTSASISAFLAIYGLLSYLERQNTWIFVWYRLAMGLFLIVAVTTHLLPANG